MKEKLKKETERATLVVESREEDRLKYQIKEYERMTMNMDKKMKDIERKNDTLEREVDKYKSKVTDIRKRHDSKETKLRLELNKKEHGGDYNTIMKLKTNLD